MHHHLDLSKFWLSSYLKKEEEGREGGREKERKRKQTISNFQKSQFFQSLTSHEHRHNYTCKNSQFSQLLRKPFSEPLLCTSDIQGPVQRTPKMVSRVTFSVYSHNPASVSMPEYCESQDSMLYISLFKITALLQALCSILGTQKASIKIGSPIRMVVCVFLVK